MVQFASYLGRVLCKTRLIFPRLNGPNVATLCCAKNRRCEWSRVTLLLMENDDCSITPLLRLSLLTGVHNPSRP